MLWGNGNSMRHIDTKQEKTQGELFDESSYFLCVCVEAN